MRYIGPYRWGNRAATGGGVVAPSLTSFTSNTASWIVPYTGSYLLKTWGGGAGGGGALSTDGGFGGGGGGGGGVAEAVVSLTAGDDLAIVIGAGGAGGTAEGYGSNGGNTSISLLGSPICSTSAASAYGGGDGSGGSLGVGQANLYGGNGYAPVAAVANSASGSGGGGGSGDLATGVWGYTTTGGTGGSAGGGNGGAGGTSGAAVAGSTYGGGGGGGRLVSGTPSAGAAGAAGKASIYGPLAGMVLPNAAFSANDTTVDDATPVTFTDASTGTPTSWVWQKKKSGDGSIWVPFSGTPTAQNPVETFAEGSWSIRLTAINATGADCQNNTDYMTVTAAVAPPVADFTATPTTIATGGNIASFTFTGTGAEFGVPGDTWKYEWSPTGMNTWTEFVQCVDESELIPDVELYSDFDLGDTPGSYDIRLTVTNLAGSDSETKTAYITVTA